MKIEFVNRSKEFAFLEQHIKNVGKANSVVLLCGESGVGKSELTKVFMHHYFQEIPSVKVPIQQAEKNSYSSGYYITKLAQLLNALAKNDNRITSLSTFFKLGNQSKTLTKKVIQDLAEDLSELMPLSKTAKGLYDLVFSKGELDENKFFQSTHSDVLFSLFEYIKYQLSEVPMIINIENIQSVDERSLELFCLLLNENKSLFLLEYTEKDFTGYTFAELVSKFEETPTFISSLFIQPLNIGDVRRIIESQPNVTWDIIQNSYITWNGNIRLLVDILARYRYSMLPLVEEAKINLLDATRNHLDSLAANDLFILILIEVHNEPVQKSLLKKIISYTDGFHYVVDLEGSLETLDRHYFLRFSDDEIMLAHDSIRPFINGIDRYVVMSLIAQKFWLDTYEELLENGDLYSSRGWQLTKVLYFASLLDYTDKVFAFLDIMSDEASKSRDPEKLIAFVEEVKKSLIEKGKERYLLRITTLNFWLIVNLYNAGYSKKAWIHLEQIEIESRKKNILKAILMEQIGRHREAIEFCANEIELEKSKGSNYELALRLVRLITNYSIGNAALAKEEFEMLYNNETFSQHFEYGFLLRNAELIFSYHESLPYYLMSIEHFAKFNAIQQMSFSRITYGVHLGLTGKTDEARLQFNAAGKDLGAVVAERHSILNNLAVLSLFEGDTSDNTEYHFRQALLTADSDFEKVAILNNYLVFLDWRQKDSESESTITSIMRILAKPSFASKEIIRYAYFNIFKYYESRSLFKESISFKELLHDLSLKETPIWKFWLHNEKMPVDDEEFFLATIDRPISFLCNWNMEFDNKLMKYE